MYCMRDVIRAYPQSHVPTICAPRAARVKTHHSPAATAATTATAMPIAGKGKRSRRGGSSPAPLWPIQDAIATSSTGNAMTGTTPSTRHSDARITIGARMDQPASCPGETV